MEFASHKPPPPPPPSSSSAAAAAAAVGDKGGLTYTTTSPMLTRATKLTPAGRPELLPSGEVELLSEAGIGVYDYSASMLNNRGGKGRATIVWSNCNIVLTNLRLIILYPSTTTSGTTTTTATTTASVYIPLALVQAAEDLATFFRASARIRVRSRAGTQHAIELKFNEGGKDAYLLHLLRALQRRSWETVPGARALEADDSSSSSSSTSSSTSASGTSSTTGGSTAASFSSRSAGVSGIIRRREQQMGFADAKAEAAMVDLDALMKAAGDMVLLVERYSAILAERQAQQHQTGGSSSSSSSDYFSETSSEAGERNEVESILQNIGVISPVTKFSAGRLYHEQLAQQIADVLLTNDRISKLGGMVAATDVYCIYNRARGTELVSPDDFQAAVKLFNARPGLHLQLVQLDSGVTVIKDTKLSQQDIFQRLIDLARQQPSRGVSINDVSIAFHISYLIARDQVMAAEAEGVLCRDDCLSGLQFYENIYWK